MTSASRDCSCVRELWKTRFAWRFACKACHVLYQVVIPDINRRILAPTANERKLRLAKPPNKQLIKPTMTEFALSDSINYPVSLFTECTFHSVFTHKRSSKSIFWRTTIFSSDWEIYQKVTGCLWFNYFHILYQLSFLLMAFPCKNLYYDFSTMS